MDGKLKEIILKVEENGGKIYQVGGSVRDEILGIPNNDEDYCVTGLEEKEFENIFPNALKLGKDFKVYNINGKEIALARTEKKTKFGHKGFEICTNKNITIEQDLARRDITINSIAKDLITNEYIDPFNGISDIKNKIIRATTNAFKEDPLRVYRVARFAAYLNFEVHENTIEMMKNLKEELLYLPKERIFKEFEKALKSQNPQIFFNVLLKSQILDVHFREIYELREKEYEFVMNSLKRSAEITDDEKIRFAVLVQKMDIKSIKNLGTRIGLPKKWIKCGKEIVLYYDKCKYFNDIDLSDKVDLIECVSKSILGIEGLKIISISNNNFNIEYNNIINFEKISNEMLRKINGQYIINKYNIKDGRIFKDKLKEERMYWLRENYTNDGGYMFNLKSERGSVVVYVLVTMIVFTIICIAIFIRSSNKQQMQMETLDKLQELYSSSETAEDVYKKHIGGDVIPIYTQEQFLAIGSGSVMTINNTSYKLSKGLTYYLQSNINITSGNDITSIINMIKNKEINFDGQGYSIYMSNGDVYTEDSNYTEPE